MLVFDELVDKIADYWVRELVEPFDKALGELYTHGTTVVKTAEGEKRITLEHMPFPFLDRLQDVEAYARRRIKQKYNIRNPPPWMISTYTGKAYPLPPSRSITLAPGESVEIGNTIYHHARRP